MRISWNCNSGKRVLRFSRAIDAHRSVGHAQMQMRASESIPNTSYSFDTHCRRKRKSSPVSRYGEVFPGISTPQRRIRCAICEQAEISLRSDYDPVVLVFCLNALFLCKYYFF